MKWRETENADKAEDDLLPSGGRLPPQPEGFRFGGGASCPGKIIDEKTRLILMSGIRYTRIMKNYSILLCAALVSGLALTSCETAGEGAKKGAIYGAAAGIAKGALDNKDHNVLKSGIIGAGIGAGAGAAIGHHNQNN